jgi:hypothetical protein
MSETKTCLAIVGAEVEPDKLFNKTALLFVPPERSQ